MQFRYFGCATFQPVRVEIILLRKVDIMPTRTVKFVSAITVVALSLLSNIANAQNLISNGDFSLGNTGFTSQYQYIAHGPNNPDEYGVIKNPSKDMRSGYASFGDHTTGSGLMLFVDGAGSRTRFWSENIPLQANTDYNFIGWVRTLGDVNPPTLRFLENTTQIGVDFHVIISNDWQKFEVPFHSSINTIVSLSIVDLNTVAHLNDFVVDDFFIKAPAVPEPSSLALLLIGGLAGLGMFLRRRCR